MYLGNAWSQSHCKDWRQKRSLTLQMTSRCLLLENELSCRQWSTSSCQRLHFTWKSVNVCAPPGWRKTAEWSDVKSNICLLQSASRFMQMLPLCYTDIITGLYIISKFSYLGFFIQNKGSTFWTNQQIQLQKQILSAAKMDKQKLKIIHCRTASCWADCPSACTCSSLRDVEPPASSASVWPLPTCPAGCNSQPAEAKTEAQERGFHSWK